MRVMQATLGTFHQFELARELERRDSLETIFSTFPWARLKREGLPHCRVETFPYVHTPQFVLGRYARNRNLDSALNILNRRSFDRWVEWKTSRRPAPDALVALSGSVYHAALALQQRGTIFVCDRGSTHQAHQEAILAEESLRWGLTPLHHDPRIRELEVQSYASAAAITVGCHAAARTFVEQGVPAEKLHVLPYGVRLEQFFKVADPPTDSFEVLFVGVLSLRKGIPYLLHAFAALQHPAKRLTLIGGLDAELKHLLPRLPMENVHLLGSLPQSSLIEHMSRSHVLVLPSIEDGFGMVMAQAMACGCPILASNGTGAGDLYTDGTEGFIVPIRDAPALASRLQLLADDPALRDRMGAAAIERVKSLGGWSHYGNLWQSLLQSLTGKP